MRITHKIPFVNVYVMFPDAEICNICDIELIALCKKN
jgi:hypothetical protein